MRVGLRSMVYANQNQLWLQRNRSECVGGHAVHPPVVIHRNDSYSSGKGRHCLSELDLSCTHVTFSPQGVREIREKLSEFYHEPGISRPGRASAIICATLGG